MKSQEEHFLSPTWLQHQPAIFSLAFWYVLFHCLIPFIFDFTSQLYEQRDDNVIILVSFIFRDWSSLAQFYSRNCCCWNPYKNWKRFLYWIEFWNKAHTKKSQGWYFTPFTVVIIMNWWWWNMLDKWVNAAYLITKILCLRTSLTFLEFVLNYWTLQWILLALAMLFVVYKNYNSKLIGRLGKWF